VISPFAKPHYVSHEVLSHVSVLRMVQARYGLPALSARDANATPPFDLFDFQNPSFTTPPTLPEAVVDATELARCKSLYP
jgi:phospholipase C